MAENGAADYIAKGKFLMAFLFFMVSPVIALEQVIDPSMLWRLAAFVCIGTAVLVQRDAFRFLVPVPIVLAFFGMLCLVLVGAMNAFAISELFFGLTKLLMAGLALLFFVNALQTQKQNLFWALRLVTSALLPFVGFKILNLQEYSRTSTYDFSFFYEHRNVLAAFFLLLFGLQWYDGTINPSNKAKWQARVNAVLLFAAIVVLQVRSVYMALGLFLAGVVVLGMVLKIKRQAIFGGLCLAAFFGGGFAMTRANSLQGTQPMQNLQSFEQRLFFWKKSAQVIADHPLIGCGAGNWQFNYAATSLEDADFLQKGGTALHPHNEFIAIISETGLLGIVLVVLVLLFLTQQIVYALRTTKNEGLLILAALVLAILTEACFSFPKERALTLVTVALVVALSLVEMRLVVPLPLGAQVPIKAIVAVLLLFIGSDCFFRIKGEYYTKQLLGFQQLGQTRKMVSAGKKAVSTFYEADASSSPVAAYIGAAYYALGRPDSMVMECQKALEIAPYDYECLSNLGFALTRYGDQTEARSLLQEALRINPHYEGAWLNLAVLDYSQGKIEDAYHAILQIDSVANKYPEQLNAIYQAYTEQVRGN